VTALAFFSSRGISFIASVSKDTLLKVWDMTTQYCVQSIVGHRCEIWSLANISSANLLVTGSSDEFLRGYTYNTESSSESSGLQDEEVILVYSGLIKRAVGGVDRCTGLALNAEQSLLVAQSHGKAVEVFTIRDRAAAKKKLSRRLKRLREKLSKEDANTEEVDAPDELISTISISDWLESVSSIRCTSRVRSAAMCVHTKNNADSRLNREKLLLALTNNSVEIYNIPLHTAEGAAPSKQSTIDLEGHRSDIRAVCLSSDGLLIASCSEDSVKVWSSSTDSCVSTCRFDGHDEGAPLCLSFAPGNKYIVAGTKIGHMLIVDTASGEISFRASRSENDDMTNESEEPAHSGKIQYIV
jgi:U3 small nucleolar RNA-associated protein 12